MVGRSTRARTRSADRLVSPPPALPAPPDVYSVDPAFQPLLAGFTCGGAHSYEREVNDIIGRLHRGQGATGAVAHLFTLPEVGLLGVSVTLPRALDKVDANAAYIGAIGIASSARGRRLPSGERLGDFMLEKTLTSLRLTDAKSVWAMIDHNNAPSQALFQRLDFTQVVPTSPAAYGFWWRQL